MPIPDLIALQSLRERVRNAKGADPALDAAITAVLNNATVRPYPPTDDFGPRDRWQFWSKDGAHFLGNEHKFRVEPVTASLDAAVALCERLEEQNPNFIAVPELVQEAITDLLQTGWAINQPFAPQLARFVIDGLLSALIAQQEVAEPC